VAISAAERLGEGVLGTTIERPGDGLLGRLERSVNAVSAKLTETHNAATTDLLTQVSSRGTILSNLFTEVPRLPITRSSCARSSDGPAPGACPAASRPSRPAAGS
jgi:hypothetical protein